ncbi:OmpW/AlkL family protein [Microbulbifer pacificus]|uniref:OmpW family outer membrane protein n=1 Tax=Microbulbifer pacificus TaxID=407164 RepID=A0AAU0MVE3_9GAMM|nr:OmpW family outer membrane protein [Microbulbifer pacificus]WOX04611.1 OmpW family outer membrane protein [Microbulbifer pacificus]
MKILRLAASLIFIPPLLASAQIPVSDLDLTRFYLRMGGSFVYPDDDGTPLKYYELQDWQLYRTNWDIEEDTTWNVSGVWRPLPYLGLELLYVGDADHSLHLENFRAYPGRDNIYFGRFSTSSANLFVNWYMTDLDCLGQPYLGIGLNYSDFYDDELNPEFQRYLMDSGMAAGLGKLGMGHSWGASAQLGIDWRLGRGFASSWLINAAVIYTDTSTDAVVTYPVSPGYERLYSDLDTNPWTLNLGITYEF